MPLEQLLDITLDIIAPANQAKRDEEMQKLRATVEQLQNEGYMLDVII